MKDYNRKNIEPAMAYDLENCSEVILDCPIDGIETRFKKYFNHIKSLATKSFGLAEAQVGVLNRHDMFQECALQFLIAWDKVKWDMIEIIPDHEERMKRLWVYLEQTIYMGMLRSLRKVSDGMPVSEYMHDKHNNSLENVKFNQFTSVNDISVNQKSTDSASLKLKYFLEDLFDKYLDRTSTGKRRASGHERQVMERSLGLGLHGRMSQQKIADELELSLVRVKEIKAAAIKVLNMQEPRAWMDESPKDMLARFIAENDIKTNSNAIEYAEERFNY